MATSNKGKKLVCFYCNKKSSVVYDGFIPEWTCKKCEATNYLDQNGEITDVPAHGELASSPAPTGYASRSNTSSPEPNSVFCTTCVKNQHLYTASLQQYELDLGIVEKATPMQWAKAGHQIELFKRGLEQRYPLVCEDCHPRVLERMKQANYVAKTDDLRQRLERTARRRQATSTESGIFSIRTFDTIGKTSTNLAFFIQMLWSFSVLFIAFLRHTSIFPVEAIYHTDSPLAAAAYYLPYTAWLAIGQFFWCPKFRDLLYGLKTKWPAHIKGYGTYYKLQSMFICLRSIFCFFIDGLDPNDETPLLFAHSSMLLLTTLLAVYMNRAVYIDTTPLWTTPEKLPFVGPATGSPLEGMANELYRIQSSFPQRPLTPPTPTHSNLMSTQSSAADVNQARRSPPYPSPPAIQPGFFRKTPYSFHEQQSIRPRSSPNSYSMQASAVPLPPRTTPRFSDMTAAEGAHYFQTGVIPDRIKDNHIDPADEMDWSPDVSQYRAFKPAPAAERAARTTDLFGRPLANPKEFSRAPVTDQPSPFWYKVPPAPITPAQRLRNPPNQPNIRPASEEAKENFFQQSKASATGFSFANQTSSSDFMAQQKFFPQTAPSEAGNDLVDMLGGFSLREGESTTDGSKIPSPSSGEILFAHKRSGILGHLFHAVLLVLSLLTWNYTTTASIEFFNNVHMIIMLGCFLIASRTMLDHTVYSHGTFSDAVGAFFSCTEMFAAGVGLVEISSGHRFEYMVVHGMVTIGMIMIHEISLALCRA